jgi:NDP-sugar pyrophosphorylase family protein
MQAVILCGGAGLRLRPLTDAVPKCLASVRGRPFIDYQLETLCAAGLRDVLLLVGYLGDVVERYVGRGSQFGVDVRYSSESVPLGTGGALANARVLLDDVFLLLNGDTYARLDYSALWRTCAHEDFDATMAVYRDPSCGTGVRPNVALGPGGRVAAYLKSGADPSLTHVDAGVAAMRKALVDRLPLGCHGLESNVYPDVASRGRLGYVEIAEGFHDIGTPRRLAEFERTIGDDRHAHAP